MNKPEADGASQPSGYHWMSIIGTGAYGTVYKARDASGQTVAIKKIRIASSEEGMPMSMIREVSMLRQLEHYDHENIVKLKDVFTAMKNGNELRLMLVFEYVEQDLAQYLENCPSPGLGPDRIQSLMQQMLTGIDFLHTLRIVHRDLKPQNVLITNSGQLKLADFGLSRIYSFSMALTQVVVTLWYRSPEVLLQDTYCTAVDLWSCGCIFAELFNRKPLFSGQSELDQLVKIFEITGLPPSTEWPLNAAIPRSSFSSQHRKRPWPSVVKEIDADGSDLLERLLTFDQRKRICASEALRHPYFTHETSEHCDNTASEEAAQVLAMMSQSAGAHFMTSQAANVHFGTSQPAGAAQHASQPSMTQYMSSQPSVSSHTSHADVDNNLDTGGVTVHEIPDHLSTHMYAQMPNFVSSQNSSQESGYGSQHYTSQPGSQLSQSSSLESSSHMSSSQE